jgi:hypothetical protein
MNELEAFFVEHFNVNQVYSSQEIRHLFQEATIPIPNAGNPTAFTYNRWNIGMTKTFTVFEYLGNAEYRYLGLNFPFNGIVIHCPQNNQTEAYAIAIYENGVCTFLNNEINSFDEWKNHQDNQDEIVVSLECFVTLTSHTGQEFRCLIIQNPIDGRTTTNGFGHVRIDSNLGQQLLWKRVNDQIIINNNTYKINSITRN